MGLSVDSTLKSLLDYPKAKEVLIKHFGDKTSDSRIYEVMYESLRSLAFSGSQSSQVFLKLQVLSTV